jgi:hypothetical protein
VAPWSKKQLSPLPSQFRSLPNPNSRIPSLSSNGRRCRRSRGGAALRARRAPLFRQGQVRGASPLSQILLRPVRVQARVLSDVGFSVSELQLAADYEAIIAAVKGQSVKAKQLAAQLIPRFFRSFPALATRAMSAMFDLVDMEELAVFARISLDLASLYARISSLLAERHDLASYSV